jgi:hypothetical protein
VSCPTTTFCAASDAFGDLVTSTSPAGGASAWQLSEAVAGADAVAGALMPVGVVVRRAR